MGVVRMVDSENLCSQKSTFLFKLLLILPKLIHKYQFFYFDVLIYSSQHPKLMPYFHTSLKSSLQMSLQCLATQFLHFSFHTIIALKCQTLLFTIYLKILVQFGSVRVTRTFFSGKPNERRLRGLESVSSKRKRRERAVGGQRRGAQKSSLLRQEMFEQFSVQCIY